MDLDKIAKNPASKCSLPNLSKREVKVMDDEIVSSFLEAVNGHRFEAIFFVDLFTGLRQGEILGLSWNCIDFKKGIVTIKQQLLQEKEGDKKYYIDVAKHDKIRRIALAPVIIDKLRQRKSQQSADRLRAGDAWDNPWNLVFTNEVGKHLTHHSVRDSFKRIVTKLGHPDLTFHSLRHSCAVIPLMSGDDPKTVQENLGHHDAGFTLNVYGHVTKRMREESAKRMDQYIKGINKA